MIEPPTDDARVEQLPLVDRVVALLGEDSPLSARELEERLGISRTALNQATRALLDAGRIACSGQGRALLYSSLR